MNPELQYKFEKELVTNGVTEDRRIFNKDKKGVYTHEMVWWMYRIWIMKEAEIERLDSRHKKQVEESFMLGYTDAENDFRLRSGLHKGMVK